MKRNLLAMFTAVSLLLITSCAKDPSQSPTMGNGSVTFTAQLPAGLGTRAIGDGTTATNLSYAVYEAGTTTPLITSVREVKFQNLTATITLNLVTGKTYDFLFWADADNSPYTFDAANRQITVDYTDALSNDENRDAFFHAEKALKISGQINKSIELTRPFAQVNIGTSDKIAAQIAGLEVAKSTVTISSGSTLNLYDGSVSGMSYRAFAYNTLPTNPDSFTVQGKGDYGYIAMNYVLVGADKSLITCAFGIQDASGTVINSISLSNVPAQRNYRTNIFGALLTSEANLEIEIAPQFDEPDYNYSELLLAAKNGGKVTLEEDVVLASSMYVAANKSMTIDLNGQDISYTGNSLAITVSGDLTINGNGSVYGGSGGNNQAIHVYNGGKLTINGGTYSVGADANNAGNTCIETSGGEIAIYGGTFSSAEMYSGVYWVLNMNDAVDNKIKVYGGTFINFDPANTHTEPAEHSNNFVADGYKSVCINENATPKVYVVVPEEITAVAGSTETLATAVSGDNANVVLISSATPYVLPTTIGSNATISGQEGSSINTRTTATIAANNVTLSNLLIDGQVAEYKPTSSVTITGSNATVSDLTFTKGNTDTWSCDLLLNNNDKTAVYTISNCDFRKSGFRGLRCDISGEVVIDNCLFDNTYPIHSDSGTGILTVKNSSLLGWTSYTSTIQSASFTNCVFGKSTSGLAFARPYANTVFENCTFSADFTVGCGIGGITIEFNNCKRSDGSAIDSSIIDTTETEAKNSTWKFDGTVHTVE